MYTDTPNNEEIDPLLNELWESSSRQEKRKYRILLQYREIVENPWGTNQSWVNQSHQT